MWPDYTPYADIVFCLQDVHDFVDSLDALTSLNYSLASTHPRKVYDSSCLQQTLTELGLTPSAMLLVQYVDKQRSWLPYSSV